MGIDQVLGDGFGNGGFSNGGFSNGGFSNGGFSNGGFSNGGFSNGGFSNGGFSNGGFSAGFGGSAIPFGDPLVENGKDFNLIKATAFPDQAWSPALRAQLILAEFAEQPWRKELHGRPWKEWSDKYVAEFGEYQGLHGEILQLIFYRDRLRSSRVGEISAQVDGVLSYWSNMLMIGTSNKPNTAILLATGMLIGTMVGLHFKNKWKRPRPVQLFPALMPAIPTPAHPAYPSGHALQSYLILHLITMALDGNKDNPAYSYMLSMANRISENREIAGLHYPTDKFESEALAGEVVHYFEKCPQLLEVIDAAKLELGDIKKGDFEMLPTNAINGPGSFPEELSQSVAERIKQILENNLENNQDNIS